MKLIKSYCDICDKETNHYSNGKCCSCIAKFAAFSRKPEHFKKAEEIKKKNREILKKSNPEEYKRRFCEKQTAWIKKLSIDELSKRGIYASKSRSSESIKQTTQKLIEGNKKSWDNDDGSRAELSRRLLEESKRKFREENREEYLAMQKEKAKLGGFSPNFELKDGILYYKNEPWTKVKERFYSQIFNQSIHDFALELGGIIQPTYRTEEFSFVGKSAMEKDIADKNIGWFVYIKFIKEGSSIKPAVVGKTGSKLVCSESDVSFDYDDIDSNRPCRKYINETNNCDWYKDAIIIIPCKSEKEALELEKIIYTKYKLFYS